MQRVLHTIIVLLACIASELAVAREYLIMPQWENEKSDFSQAIVNDDYTHTFSYTRMDSFDIKTVDTQATGNYSLDISIEITNLNNKPHHKYPQYYKDKHGKIKRGGYVSRPVYGWVVGMKDKQHFNAVLLRPSYEDDAIYTSPNLEYRIITVNGHDVIYHTDWESCFFDNMTNSLQRNRIWIQYKNNKLWLGGGLLNDIAWNVLDNITSYGNLTGLYLGAAANVKVENVFIFVNDNERVPHTQWNNVSLNEYYKTHRTTLLPLEGFWDIIYYRNEGDTDLKMGGEYRLAIVAQDDGYDIIYLSGAKIHPNRWQEGHTKGHIKSNYSNIYGVTWYDAEGVKLDNVFATFSGKHELILKFGNNTQLYLTRSRVDDKAPSPEKKWSSGSGFAISQDGYIVTNYHVIKDANRVKVSNPNSAKESVYNATVVASDSIYDLAILRIDDKQFDSLGAIPYGVSNRVARQGEEIFYMGYPLPNALSTEIKTSSGIITAQNGINASQYMISVDIDSGCSGSPLFDIDGNVVGIISAKILKSITQLNANLAVKTPYLFDLIERAGELNALPQNRIKELSHPDKIEAIAPYVFLVYSYYD